MVFECSPLMCKNPDGRRPCSPRQHDLLLGARGRARGPPPRRVSQRPGPISSSSTLTVAQCSTLLHSTRLGAVLRPPPRLGLTRRRSTGPFLPLQRRPVASRLTPSPLRRPVALRRRHLHLLLAARQAGAPRPLCFTAPRPIAGSPSSLTRRLQACPLIFMLGRRAFSTCSESRHYCLRRSARGTSRTEPWCQPRRSSEHLEFSSSRSADQYPPPPCRGAAVQLTATSSSIRPAGRHPPPPHRGAAARRPPPPTRTEA
jgi:hypothetical protein